jgi:alpha-beta hydrolase superfamily lysophospholipase
MSEESWDEKLGHIIEKVCQEKNARGFWFFLLDENGHASTISSGRIRPRHLLQHAEEALHSDMADPSIEPEARTQARSKN